MLNDNLVATGYLEKVRATGTPRPPASVIIVAYNGRDYLRPCLDALSLELGPADEVIVVDNGSADGSADLLAGSYPEARLLLNEDNVGFAAACNQGAARARGDILVFLNQDTRVEKGWLSSLVEAVARDHSVGLATSKVLLLSHPDRLHLAGQHVHITGLVSGRGYMEPADRWDRPADVAAVSGASFAIRRLLWEHLGGFDETFFMYYEETDLSWRAWLAGYRCLYVPASKVHHDDTPGPPDRRRLYYANRNRVLLLLKNLRLRTLFTLAPALILAELMEWFMALANGKPALLAKAQAHWWLITHLGQVARSRRRVRPARLEPDANLLPLLSARLRPSHVAGGKLGLNLVRLASACFAINHSLAVFICGKRGW